MLRGRAEGHFGRGEIGGAERQGKCFPVPVDPFAQQYRIPVDCSEIGVAGKRHVDRHDAVVVALIEHERLSALLQVGEAVAGARLVPRFIQRRKQHRRQNRDDRYYHEQLNQRKTATG